MRPNLGALLEPWLSGSLVLPIDVQTVGLSDGERLFSVSGRFGQRRCTRYRGQSIILMGCDKDYPITLQLKYRDERTEFVEIAPIKHSCLTSRSRVAVGSP